MPGLHVSGSTKQRRFLRRKSVIERLSKGALLKILSGNVLEDGTCVIKFYSNTCHLCHALKDIYEEVANDYDNIYFFMYFKEF